MCGYGDFVPTPATLVALAARGLHAAAGIPYRTRFWDPQPVLPVAVDGAQAEVVDWGWRGDASVLPSTGWARAESVVEGGRWAGRSVLPVVIPFVLGGEKGGQFDIDGEGIDGLLLDGPAGKARAFMVTVPADDAYRDRTGHDRMPRLRPGTTLRFRGAAQPRLF